MGGNAADRFGATRALVISLSLLTLLLALLPLATHDLLPGLPALVLWGAAGASFFAPQQHRLLGLASKHANVILALNNSAFYLGTAGGAALGGAVLRFLPVMQLGWVGTCSAFLALLLVLLSLWMNATDSSSRGMLNQDRKRRDA
jgi:predicted MFS family arabinose efflux permease